MYSRWHCWCSAINSLSQCPTLFHQSRDSRQMNDALGAAKHASTAKTLNIVSTAIGVIIIFILFVVMCMYFAIILQIIREMPRESHKVYGERGWRRGDLSLQLSATTSAFANVWYRLLCFNCCHAFIYLFIYLFIFENSFGNKPIRLFSAVENW